MNIVFFTRRFWPDIGGVEKHVWKISKRFVAKGHKVTIVTQSKNPSNKKLPQKGVRVLRIPDHNEENEKVFIWQWLWKHKRVIENADVIHCHDVFFWYLPFRFRYPTKKVFTTFHGYEGFPIKKKAIVVRKMSELLSWGNICVGDFIPKWYRTHPTYVSYGAVELPKSKEQKTKSKKYSAVFIGRLDEQTGIIEYVKAVELLRKDHSKFDLLVVGDGKYKEFIDEKVKILGFKKKPEKYFQNQRFAFVSRYLSILEAFAAKRLVFALYDNPIKEDYLRMAPFAKYIVIAKNPAELARKVQFVLNNPRIEKQMIESAYTWVKEQTWEAMLKTYLSLWKKG